MYASIRSAKGQPGAVPEITRRIQDGFVSIVSKLPGFVNYYVVRAEDDVVVTVSIFDSQASAEASNQKAAEWVRQNLSDLVATPLEFATGEIAVHQAA